jgi:2-isopropylmalate synthase
LFLEETMDGATGEQGRTTDPDPGRDGAAAVRKGATDRDPGRVLIFDTSLRDGEQSPGASMTSEEKLEMARALAALGVDVLEAGFPISSPGDFESVATIAAEVEGPIIAGLARAARADIERAWQAVRHADRPRIHVFLATSEIHRTHKLRMACEEIVRRTGAEVARARDYCDDVEFSPEDASRTEPDFLVEVVQAAVDAGATTINIPDTVGYAVPEQFGALFRHLVANVRGVEHVVLSAHCHDDLGLAVANTLAAVGAGARQIECTINGIGERAGNCSLEEVVMAIRTRRDFFGLHTGIRSERLYPTSRMLTRITGLHVQRNKAIVGANAFAHEAGIHQHGMLMHHRTYEIMRPEDVGVAKSRLVLGKHSGRHAFRARLDELGYFLDEAGFEALFTAFKRLADRKREVCEADLEALMDAHGPAEGTSDGKPWEAAGLAAATGTRETPRPRTATAAKSPVAQG